MTNLQFLFPTDTSSCAERDLETEILVQLGSLDFRPKRDNWRSPKYLAGPKVAGVLASQTLVGKAGRREALSRVCDSQSTSALLLVDFSIRPPAASLRACGEAVKSRSHPV